MEAAKLFVSLWPECRAWHVTILTHEKRAVVHRPAVATQELLASLDAWLRLQQVHVFIRPLINTLVFLDLDGFHGDWQALQRLRPRCISQTSAGNYQFWATLPPPMQVKSVSWVTRELQQIFHGDPHSISPQQQGRLPGSMNVKPGKMFLTTIIHHSHDHLCEETFLQLTPKTILAPSGEALRVVRQPARGSQPPKAPSMDRSRNDWQTCCVFFEQNPDSTVEDALSAITFEAQRPNQDYYKRTTLTKARDHVLQQQPASATRGVGSASVSSEPQPAAANVVSLEAVQQMVDDAIKKRLPAQPVLKTKKMCVQCEQELPARAFSQTQFRTSEPVCLQCAPVDTRMQKRLKASKVCVQCGEDRPRDQYSSTQWDLGATSRCTSCVHEMAAGSKKIEIFLGSGFCYQSGFGLAGGETLHYQSLPCTVTGPATADTDSCIDSLEQTPSVVSRHINGQHQAYLISDYLMSYNII